MATESPMRIVDTTTTAGKWRSVKDHASFGSHNLVADELGLLLKGHETQEDQRSIAPNRSGSAPPSMEGSYASSGHLLYSHKSSWDSAVASSGSGFHYYQPGDRVRSDSSKYVNSTSDIDPTAKFPQPFISREGKKQMQYMGAMVSNWNLRSSGGGSSDGSKLLTRNSLSTHHEEPEDEISSQKGSEELADNRPLIMSVQDLSSMAGQHKSLVDLIQADFSRTPSSAYYETPSSSVIETVELGNLSLDVTKSPDPKPGVESGTKVEKTYRSKVIDNSSTELVSKKAYRDKSGGMISIQKNTADRKDQHSQVQLYQDQATTQSNNMITTPPLYASAAAYMTSGSQYFSNPHPPLYAPPYSTSGYTFGSTYVPPFVATYPSHSGIPIGFDPSSTQSLNSQTFVSPGESITQVGEQPLYNKFYGHQGFVVQPPFPDPLQMQYFHYPPENSFSPQYGSIPSANFLGDQFGTFAPQRDPTIPLSPNASLSIMSPRNIGMYSNNFYGNTPGAGYVPRYPGSLSSPVGAANQSGRKYDPRFPQGFVRRGSDSHIDTKKHSFLEELKANNARKVNLSDIVEQIVEFSVDQHGSRFIQQKLENCSAEEKVSVFKEVLPHASKLMTDVFGNYVIQKFFEHGDSEQRKELANKLLGQMLPLSLQMYGCRVIQKALEVIEIDQKTTLAHELDGHVMRCVRDQNGNHVIQKCIECLPTENIGFIISAFNGQVSTLSTHPYGCRVIQRVLEHCCDESQTQCIVDEILESSIVLAQDQYGNYVTQHVLERGKAHERKKIISKLEGKMIEMSQHKYASNVVEKCLEYGDAMEREIMVNEILAQPEENDNLLMMMKDQYANYVVQKMLEISNDKQHNELVKRIRGHVNALKKYTYGKHIVARFEQLSGEEEEDSGTSEP